MAAEQKSRFATCVVILLMVIWLTVQNEFL